MSKNPTTSTFLDPDAVKIGSRAWDLAASTGEIREDILVRSLGGGYKSRAADRLVEKRIVRAMVDEGALTSVKDARSRFVVKCGSKPRWYVPIPPRPSRAQGSASRAKGWRVVVEDVAPSIDTNKRTAHVYLSDMLIATITTKETPIGSQAYLAVEAICAAIERHVHQEMDLLQAGGEP